jgi:hypothetical protein
MQGIQNPAVTRILVAMLLWYALYLSVACENNGSIWDDTVYVSQFCLSLVDRCDRDIQYITRVSWQFVW